MNPVCAGCDNLDLPNEGGYCYMFRDEPTNGLCGQHTEVQRVVVASLTLTKIALSAAVLAVQTRSKL